MTKAKVPTLAERVAKLEETTGLRTAAAPPPPKDPVPANYFADYVREKCKVADLQFRLDISKQQQAPAQASIDFYKGRCDRETARADKYQAEAEALRGLVPKAGSVVAYHDAKEARAYFVAIAAMTGAALGALVGGLLL